MMGRQGSPVRPFAPPFLEIGKLVVAHTANILQVIGPRLGLVPDDERSRVAAHQLQLSITDFVAEVHDTHHPIATSLYYEDQKAEARARSKHFIKERIPKYLGYFESVLAANKANAKGKGPYALGRASTYVDLSLFQVLVGLAYAFPEGLAAHREGDPAPRRAPRSRGGAPAHQGLPRLRTPHPLQRRRHFQAVSRARRVGGCASVRTRYGLRSRRRASAARRRSARTCHESRGALVI